MLQICVILRDNVNFSNQLVDRIVNNSNESIELEDLRISSIIGVDFPAQVMDELPASKVARQTVHRTRRKIHEILTKKDDRLVVIVGPCSIHDPKAAIEYARKLADEKENLADDLLIVMRVYFEKPRTTIGWKGLINDPNLNGSFDMNKGLKLARSLLMQINDLGLPAGVEFLDIISPQYIADLVSWGAIGARTTESQVHRQLVSGLSCPVGLKNGTDGNVKIAVDGAHAGSKPHRFLSITKEGQTAIFETKGNEDGHIILRGGKEPNYSALHVDDAAQLLKNRGLNENVMIDFSHANSSKDFSRQRVVAEEVSDQISGGDNRIIGVMIESNLVEGRQDVFPGRDLTYGQSITDACIGWEDTVQVLELLSDAVRNRRHGSAIPTPISSVS